MPSKPNHGKFDKLEFFDGGLDQFAIHPVNGERPTPRIAGVFYKPMHDGKCEGWESAACFARLFAAAPDLLAALKKCDNAFVAWQLGQIPGRPEDILALIAEVRAAIAKAEGRTT